MIFKIKILKIDNVLYFPTQVGIFSYI